MTTQPQRARRGGSRPVSAVLAAVARDLAAAGPAALPEALATIAAALGCDDILLRTPDRTAVIARTPSRQVPARPAYAPYLLDVPVRRITELVGVLTVAASRPLTDADAALVNGLAAIVALALAVDDAAPARSAARSILDEEADRAQAAATLYEGLGDALVTIRYAAELVASGRAEVSALDEPVRAALTAFRHAHRDGQAHALTLGLREALGRLPERFAGDRLDDGMPELRVSVTADDPELDELSPSVAVLVQRIAEIALRGALGQARVLATCDGSRVKLWVESAEIAYDASELGRWSRRASALGGDLAVRSGGVELDLPILP